MKDSKAKSILRKWLDDNTPINIESIDPDYCQLGEALIKTKSGELYILSLVEVDPAEIDEI